MSNNVKDKVKIAKNDTSILAGFEPRGGEVLYGPPPLYTGSEYKIKTGGIIFAIILFIIGLIALFNKKLSKKAKVIICVSTITLIILTFIIVKYLTTDIPL